MPERPAGPEGAERLSPAFREAYGRNAADVWRLIARLHQLAPPDLDALLNYRARSTRPIEPRPTSGEQTLRWIARVAVLHALDAGSDPEPLTPSRWDEAAHRARRTVEMFGLRAYAAAAEADVRDAVATAFAGSAVDGGSVAWLQERLALTAVAAVLGSDLAATDRAILSEPVAHLPETEPRR